MNGIFNMKHDNTDSVAFYKAETALKNFLKKEKPKKEVKTKARKHQRVEARARNGSRKR